MKRTNRNLLQSMGIAIAAVPENWNDGYFKVEKYLRVMDGLFIITKQKP